MKDLFKIADFHYFLSALTAFWQKCPALLYGIAFFLGCLTAFQWHNILILPILFLWFPWTFPSIFKTASGLRYFFAFLIFLGAIGYIKFSMVFPNTSQGKDFPGTGIFSISNITLQTKHYGQRWSYQGTILFFAHDDTIIAKNIPCTIDLASKLTRPPADSSYRIQGTLREIDNQKLILIPDKDKPWLPIEGSWSLAEFRYHAKKFVTKYIHEHIQNEHSAVFLAGIATGDFQDRLMCCEFSRFGLQHIMAISGFHFAIVASILNILLRLILSKSKATILLMVILSSYFVFLGCGPSIMRAWIMSFIVLLSFLIEKKSYGLNSLGLALFAILLFDPTVCWNIGFQFSFAATAAILLLFPGVDILLQSIYTKRSLRLASRMNYWNQHGYYLLVCIRQGIALTIAVNVITLPITLYYFHKFPWLSLVYNLFFPFMVSISMVFLIMGILACFFIPPLGNFIHAINSRYTNFMLDYTYNIPTSVDVVWHVAEISIAVVVSILCLVYTAGIVYRYYQEKKLEESDDWAFI